MLLIVNAFFLKYTLVHLAENKREYNKQAYARQKAKRLKQIASGEGSSQHTTVAKTPERVPLGILENQRVIVHRQQ